MASYIGGIVSCEIQGNMTHTSHLSNRADNNANPWDGEGLRGVHLSRSRLRGNENYSFCFGPVSFHVSIKLRVDMLSKQWSIGAWSPGEIWSGNVNLSVSLACG